MTCNEKPLPGVTSNWLFLMMFLVGATGFEPATFATQLPDQIAAQRGGVAEIGRCWCIGHQAQRGWIRDKLSPMASSPLESYSGKNILML